MFNRFNLFVRASFVAALFVGLGNISGCASDAEIAAANGEQSRAPAAYTSTSEEDTPASSSGVVIDSSWEGRSIEEILNDATSPLSQRVFYFGYDESSISLNDREILTQHSEFLLAHPDLMVTIEGHADERGSREYNLALGERRGRSVERLFTLLGVAKSQQKKVSFGEERPTALGHDESAWHFNRRVELLYSGY